MIAIALMPPIIEARGLKDYLPLHTALETVSIIIAMLIFAIGWSSYSNHMPTSIMFLSVLFFGVAIFDFSHVLSYAGMPDFVTPSSVDKGIDFWLSARVLSSFGLLLFFFLPTHKLSSKSYKYAFLGIILLLIGVMHWLILYAYDLIPHVFFMPGQGLTLLKIRVEYTIVVMNIIAAIVLLRRMRHPLPYQGAALFGALCIMAMGELFFTLYADVTDVYNIFGHIYKAIAYLFIYRAIFVTTVERPYKELKRSQDKLINSERSLKESQIIAGLGSYTLDLRTGIWRSSEILDQLFGIDKTYERSMEGWKKLLHPDDRVRMEHYFRDEVIDQAQPFNEEYCILRHDDHTKHWVHGLGMLEFDEYNNPIIMKGTIQDITKRKEVEEHIEKLAHYDHLTGLPNRILLSDRITFLLNHAQRNNEPLAVMFLDIDHFKNINDTLGHTIGDKLLIEIAKRIKGLMRDEDTVSRSGGDEFILLFPDTDVNAAMHIAAKLIDTVSIPSTIDHHELTVTPSIGIAIYPNDGENFDTLLKNADTAMYQAKRLSRNAFQFFTQEMQLHSARNLQLVNALRHALERNELHLHYQPQISTYNGNIIGAEALLRWNHPEFGMISPAEFIPIAEDSGQIIQIGEWVLRTAVRQMKEWKDSGLDSMIIAVNLSAVQFQQKNLIELVTAILDEAQLPHEYLELELTEAITMNDPQSAIDIMNKLHEHGIRMSIDDFGTGYSSLSYLKQFKVYKLKIDQSFIRNIANDAEDQAIVKAIIDMAKSLGMQTIAEGVETAEQLAFLRQHKCNEIQGYYYSKPIPADQFSQFFKERV